jgi:hypothetical protein
MNTKSIQRYLQVFCGLLILAVMAGCGAPVPLSTETIFNSPAPQLIRVGAGAEKITPLLPTFTAGNFPFRLGIKAHDDLWARSVVFDDGSHRVALVSLDLIGINYDDVLLIRSEIAAAAKVDYILVAATHTHTAPDLVGFWAPYPLKGDDPYRMMVRAQVGRAIQAACDTLRPAILKIASDPVGNPPLNQDYRLPINLDDIMTVWQAVDQSTGATIVTSIHFATHPILVPSVLDISSDFCHYLRLAVESGMEGDDGPVAAQGGLCLYFNADMAGRLVPESIAPLTTVPTAGPDYQCAQAYGYNLAHRAQKILTENANIFSLPMGISVAARPVLVPVDNDLLRTAVNTRIINRPLIDNQITSEVGVVRVGPMEFFAIPGMIFPELVRSQFTLAPIPGSDFPDAAPEAPRLDQLGGQPYFIPIGLANDMLGYLIPKCLYDAQAPFSDNPPPYGEVVCPSPDAAGVILNAFDALKTGIPK